MPKRSRKKAASRPQPRRAPGKKAPKTREPEPDQNQLAYDLIRYIEETGSSLEAPPRVVKNPMAVALGRLGGLKGGKARADRLTPAERRHSAMKAAHARWKGKPPR